MRGFRFRVLRLPVAEAREQTPPLHSRADSPLPPSFIGRGQSAFTALEIRRPSETARLQGVDFVLPRSLPGKAICPFCCTRKRCFVLEIARFAANVKNTASERLLSFHNPPKRVP